MKKGLLFLLPLVVMFAFTFTEHSVSKKEVKVMPTDTIKALNLQKINQKTCFKAPNGKTYEVTFETPIQGLDKEKLDCVTDTFHGKARKTPKTTIVTATMVNFTGLKTFLMGLPKDDVISKKLESLPKTQLEKRADEEKQNVKLTNVFLIAVKREPDNDFHMIIGDKASGGGNFFNTENTGLVTTSPQKLKDVRKKILDFMGGAFCSSKYQKFTPGIPIEIEGSLFYDTEHEPGAVGPATSRPKTSWEIHPITNIIFK